jgi:hypothetical protein
VHSCDILDGNRCSILDLEDNVLDVRRTFNITVPSNEILCGFVNEIAARLPRVDLPDILLEIAARTDFTAKFTHISERDSRAGDLAVSICAVLLAEACYIGMELLVRNDVPALRRSRLSWVSQNFVRNESIMEANASLVATHNNIPLVHAWGCSPTPKIYAGPVPVTRASRAASLSMCVPGQ